MKAHTAAMMIIINISSTAAKLTCSAYNISITQPVCNINKWSKNSDNRPHHRSDFSLEKFNVRFDYFCSRPAEDWFTACGEIPTSSPSKLSLCMGDLDHHLMHGFFSPSE